MIRYYELIFSDTKCFDTTDEQKFNTLCAARNSGVSSCLNSATRHNAHEYCPLTCKLCTPNPKNDFIK